MSGIVLLAVSLVLLALARTYPPALLAVVLLSSGWSLLINVGNVLTPVAFPGGLAYATNLANVFFGLGAFLTPLALLVRRTSLSATLVLLGALALLPAALAAEVDFAALASDSTAAAATAGVGAEGIGALLVDPTMWLYALTLFFYGPLEASMGAWATTYLVDQGVRVGTAAGLLSGFWLTFMATRLVTAYSLPPGHEALLILVLALLCVGVLLGVVLSHGPVLAMMLVLTAGAVFGPIFPTLMAVLLGHVAPAAHGRAVGLLFAIGGLGWTAVPILIGAYARRTSVQRGFVIAVAAAVGLSVVALVLAARGQ